MDRSYNEALRIIAEFARKNPGNYWAARDDLNHKMKSGRLSPKVSRHIRDWINRNEKYHLS